MRKSWPFALVVIVVGGAAGVAIAGRPTPRDPFVLSPDITSAATTVTTTTTPTAASTTSTSPATTVAVTTTAAATTAAAPVTTSPPDTTTTAAPVTTVAPTTTLPGPLPPDQVRLVIANGDGRFRLASITADRISPRGYVIDLADPVATVDATIIYYRPGFDDEAAVVADDILVPDAILQPYPTSNSLLPITSSDDRGDVIIVLGPDAPR